METTVWVANIGSGALSLSAMRAHTAIVVLSNHLLTIVLSALTPWTVKQQIVKARLT